MTTWSYAQCEKRLKRIKDECEKVGSLAPVDKFFTELMEYDKANKDKPEAEENIRRIHALWDQNFDGWYMETRERMRVLGTEQWQHGLGNTGNISEDEYAF